MFKPAMFEIKLVTMSWVIFIFDLILLIKVYNFSSKKNNIEDLREELRISVFEAKKIPDQ